jgi:stringent starvation protein B
MYLREETSKAYADYTGAASKFYGKAREPRQIEIESGFYRSTTGGHSKLSDKWESFDVPKQSDAERYECRARTVFVPMGAVAAISRTPGEQEPSRIETRRLVTCIGLILVGKDRIALAHVDSYHGYSVEILERMFKIGLGGIITKAIVVTSDEENPSTVDNVLSFLKQHTEDVAILRRRGDIASIGIDSSMNLYEPAMKVIPAELFGSKERAPAAKAQETARNNGGNVASAARALEDVLFLSKERGNSFHVGPEGLFGMMYKRDPESDWLVKLGEDEPLDGVWEFDRLTQALVKIDDSNKESKWAKWYDKLYITKYAAEFIGTSRQIKAKGKHYLDLYVTNDGGRLVLNSDGEGNVTRTAVQPESDPKKLTSQESGNGQEEARLVKLTLVKNRRGEEELVYS